MLGAARRSAAEHPFQGEQRDLVVQATAVTGERPVGTDDAMAGDDDRDGVGSDGGAHGSAGSPAPDRRSHVPVRARRTEGNPHERSPNVQLEGSPHGPKGQVEGLELTRHIGEELVAHQGQGGAVADRSCGDLRVRHEASERDVQDGFTVAHRYLHQLEPDIRHAVFGNAGTIISFRVGAEDAPYIVQEFHERYEKTYFFAAPELPDVRQARDRWHAVQTVQRYYSRTAAALYRRVAHPLLRMICIRS